VNTQDESRESNMNLIVLATVSIVVGGVVGLVVAAFRLALVWADTARNDVLVWAHGEGLIGLILILAGTACAGAFAAWLVRKFSPVDTGSGIPHVETVLKQELPAAPFRLIPVKFLITQRVLTGKDAIGLVLAIFAIRFVLGPVSYAARTPGGLFAPMLVLGAQIGQVFGTACCHFFPGTGAHPIADSVVGIAAFFTAVVRAPVTGIVLAIELTGSFTLFLPMLSACFTAMLIPTLLEEPPIYDSLRASLGK
jgi:H+/Cl- antiporter ClcA